MEINKLVKINGITKEYFIGVFSKDELLKMVDCGKINCNLLNDLECVTVRSFVKDSMKLNVYDSYEIIKLFFQGKIKVNILNSKFYDNTFYHLKKTLMKESNELEYELLMNDVAMAMIGKRTSLASTVIPKNNTGSVINDKIKMSLMQKYGYDAKINFDNVLYVKFKAVITTFNVYMVFLDNEPMYASEKILSELPNICFPNTKKSYILSFVDTQDVITSFYDNGDQVSANFIGDNKKLFLKKMADMYHNYVTEISFKPSNYKLYPSPLKSIILTIVHVLKLLENAFNESIASQHKVKLGKPLLFYIISMIF